MVSQLKREKIYNKGTGTYEVANENMMREIEKIIEVSGPIDKHRESLLGRIAAFKIDHPKESIVVGKIFHEYLEAIKAHYHEEQKSMVDDNYKVMLSLGTDEAKNFKDEDLKLAELTLQNLATRFCYTHEASVDCLRFLLSARSQIHS